MSVAEAACVLVLAALHLGVGYLRFLEGVPRSRWLSLSGGVAVAYVFVHLLPDVAEADAAVERSGLLPSLERHAYLLALVGLVVFYALEHFAARSRRTADADAVADRRVLWVHLAAFGAYNVLIGYLVVHRLGGTQELVLFTSAIGLHFVVADFGLREHHRGDYDRVVRWVLAAALVAGLAAGAAVELSEAAIGLLLAFLAGAVVLNTIKEEVPGERQSRLGPFVLGAAVYAALLLAI